MSITLLSFPQLSLDQLPYAQLPSVQLLSAGLSQSCECGNNDRESCNDSAECHMNHVCGICKAPSHEEMTAFMTKALFTSTRRRQQTREGNCVDSSQSEESTQDICAEKT